MQVGEGERIAVHAVARPELALEVHRPEIIRLRGDRGHTARMYRRPAAPPRPHEPSTRQQVARGAHGRPVDGGVAWREPGEQLGRAPRRVHLAGRAPQFRHPVRDSVRAGMRGVAALAQGGSAAGVVARQPLVASLAAHAVARAEFGHRIEPVLVIGDEAFALVHGIGVDIGGEVGGGARLGSERVELREGGVPRLRLRRVRQPSEQADEVHRRCRHEVGEVGLRVAPVRRPSEPA